MNNAGLQNSAESTVSVSVFSKTPLSNMEENIIYNL